MRYFPLTAALLSIFMLTGCESIKETVSNFIDTDANIGKNAPAVMGTIADIDALNEAAEEAEEAKLTPEEKAERERKAKLEKLTKRAEELLDEMTLEEKAAQLLLVRLPKEAAAAAEQYRFGGYTMYAEDFKNETPESIKELTAAIGEASKVSPFIAVDEEGGTVVRVSKYTQFREEPFSSPQLLFERGGTELLEIDTEEKAKLLTSLGINLNLAPVADISLDEESCIYPRTMGQNAEGTSEAVSTIVRVSNSKKLASCLKHFPGYGENTDTHSGAAHDERELYEFYNRDFLPFEAGINADTDKTPAVMVGHTIYDSIDPDVPASLSEVIHDTLRERLGFDGVIITDDMGMDAITGYETESSVYVLGIKAGNDMLCVSDGEAALNDILAALENEELTEKEINKHVLRILIMKLQYSIIK